MSVESTPNPTYGAPSMMKELPWILVAELFRELESHLITLLRELSPDDWNRPTVCSQWSVKDIASHLLDGSLRRLSIQRDFYLAPEAPQGFGSNEAIVTYLNTLNADWTRATTRLSPRVLLELIEWSGREAVELFESLDPRGAAPFAVSWAGEHASLVWFDLAREYTERWHHQRQIVDAVGKPSLIDGRRLYHPVLDTFMRALPYTFREIQAEDGTRVVVEIEGEAGGTWQLLRRAGVWILVLEPGGTPGSLVRLGQETAWRLFTKRMDAATAKARFPDLAISGDPALGDKVLEMVSIMA